MKTVCATRAAWLEERKTGIGASEAAAIIGMSPYKTNVALWREKTGKAEAADIGDKPFVKYGIEAEPHLRALFALDYPQYTVAYEEFAIIRNDKYPFIFATLDGFLVDKLGRKGILEIKTTEIMQKSQWDKWDDRVPDNYFIQVLHQLIATGYDFAVLKAQIKYTGRNGEPCCTTRHYHFERNFYQTDIGYLLGKEIEFWRYVTDGKEPPTILPAI